MANPSADDSKPDFSFLNGDSPEGTGPPDLPDSLDFSSPPAAADTTPDEQKGPATDGSSNEPAGVSTESSDVPGTDEPDLTGLSADTPNFDHLETGAVDAVADFSGLSAPSDGLPAAFPDAASVEPTFDASEVSNAADAKQTPKKQSPTKQASGKSKTRRSRPDKSSTAKTSGAAGKASRSRPAKSSPDKTQADAQNGAAAADAGSDVAADSVPRSRFNALLGYAAALTLILLFLLLTGRLSGTHSLESLPDIKPLGPGEFQSVPPSAALPRHHELQLGQSRRFGDVIFTPEKVILAPLAFANMTDGKEVPDMETRPVMQLQFRLENAASDMAFAPWDVALMSYRNPEGGDGVDDDVLASSALFVDTNNDSTVRVLNYLHAAESSFDIIGQNSRARLAPGESMESLIASSDVITEHTKSAAGYRWRIHLRKGINRSSQQGITTLVDVCFLPADVKSDDDA